MDPADIANRFAFHPATTDEKRDAHTSVRQACRKLADELNAQLPDGREKALAITHLEEVMLWGNAAVARAGFGRTPATAPTAGSHSGPACSACRVLIGYSHLADCSRSGIVVAADT